MNDMTFYLEYFSHGGTNDNGRFFWHIETPPPATVTPYTLRQHRSSDTGRIFIHRSSLVSYLVLPGTLGMECNRPSLVTSSISTDFNMGTSSNNPPIIPTFPHTRPPNCKRKFSVSFHYSSILAIPTPPASRSNHLCVNGKGKCEHPNKKSSIDPAIFTR